MNESASYILKILLKKNDIKIDEKELEFQLESHPSYPSLHSLTGALSHFGVDNMAVEVPTDIETLSNIPETFIAHCENEKGECFVFVEQKENNLRLVYDKKVEEKVSYEDFLKTWTGVLLAVEKSGEENQTKENTTVSGKIFYYISALAVLGLFFWNLPNLFQSLHFLLSLTGIGISVLIIAHELGIQSKTLDKFCSGNNDKTSCDDVLKSKGATLFKTIKFSDIGFVYFAGISLAWILLGFIKNPNYNSIITITLFALPFTFFSIYYQYKVVKKWCPLCLSVLAVLWGQALCLLFSDFSISSFSIDLYSNLIILTSILTVVALWIFISPKLKLIQEHKKLKIEHYRFKKNYNIFDSLISQKQKVDTNIEESSEIIFGNKNNDPLLKVVLITNPLCGHCADAHKEVMSLLKLNIKDLQINIRFNVNIKDPESVDSKIAIQLLNIYHTETEENAIQALHEVYSDINVMKWLENKNNKPDSVYSEQLKKEKLWCHNNQIDFTPEILVNGRSFPIEYERSDLQYFIEDIIEEEQEKRENSVSKSELTTQNPS